jgi:CheY-like chemotaxis protein
VAESAGEGRGATFEVRLPAIQAPSAPASAAGPPGAHRAQRVLLVEDNDDVREMMYAALRIDGHDVRAVSDGAAALEASAKFRPDAAIVDIGLPGIDGCELAVALRARLGAGLRLIALSGYGLPEDVDRSRRAGFEAHLVKPVDPARLAALLAAGPARSIEGTTV